MGVRLPSVATITVANALPSSGATAVLLITPGINVPLDNTQVVVEWYFSLTVGTGTTGLTVQLRRGTTTSGVQVGFNVSQTVVAGNTAILSGMNVDTPGVVAAQPYCLCVTQMGCTVAGTISDLCMYAFCL